MFIKNMNNFLWKEFSAETVVKKNKKIGLFFKLRYLIEIRFLVKTTNQEVFKNLLEFSQCYF